MTARTARAGGIPRRTLTHWRHLGLIRRPWTPAEARAALAIDACRRLAGVEPTEATESRPIQDARRAFHHTVATIARAHEPGTVHEITTPVPWIRHVLIVPEDAP